MSAGILVVAEQRDGIVSRSAIEVVVSGQKLGKELGLDVSIVLLGKNMTNAANDIAHGVKEVLVVEDNKLESYTPDGYSIALKKVIEQEQPQYVFFTHTYTARDYVSKLAVSLGKHILTDCVRFKVADNAPVFIRQVFQGKIDADFSFSGNGPFLVSFQVGAFNANDLDTGSVGAVRSLDISLQDASVRTKVLEVFEGVKQEVDLSKAERIVSVGRGLKKEENLQLARDLAAVLDAEISASRPVCDDGWLPLDRQVGSSGQTVSPKLYFAIGISGAIQHIVGMKNSGTIVAINKDPHAPIFDIADYGVVGDLFEIVPPFIEAIKEIK